MRTSLRLVVHHEDFWGSPSCLCVPYVWTIYDDGSDAQMWLDSLVKGNLRQPLDYGAMTENECA